MDKQAEIDPVIAEMFPEMKAEGDGQGEKETEAGDGAGSGAEGESAKAQGQGGAEDYAGLESQFKEVKAALDRSEPVLKIVNAATSSDLATSDPDTQRDAFRRIALAAANAANMPLQEFLGEFTGKKVDQSAAMPKPSKDLEDMTSAELQAYLGERDEAVFKRAMAEFENKMNKRVGGLEKAAQSEQAKTEFKAKVEKAFVSVANQIKTETGGFTLSIQQLASAMHRYPNNEPADAVRLAYRSQIVDYAAKASGPKDGKPGPQMAPGSKSKQMQEKVDYRNPVQANLAYAAEQGWK